MSASPSPYRQLVRRLLAAALPRSWYIVSGDPAAQARVCLTFDDGPHPEHTPRLLDVLSALGVPATFFVKGESASVHPEIVKRMIAEGHGVGHHSYTHGEPAVTSAAQLAEEMDRSVALLAAIGPRPRLFRPPRGKVTVAKAVRIWLRGQTVVLWSSDPKDFAAASPSEVGDWFERHPLQPGDIVLFHDTHPHAAEVLPALVEKARRRGLSFGLVSDWCGGAGLRATR